MREYITPFLQNRKTNNITSVILLGDRTIGKTHFIFQQMYSHIQEEPGSAFMLIFRVRTQLADVGELCAKYARVISGRDWYYEGGKIYEIIPGSEPDLDEHRVIGYATYLNGADRTKTKNYDNPYVVTSFMDEIYTDIPVDKEYRKLQKVLTTVNRRTNHVTNNIILYLAGNEDMGISPILEDYKIDTNNDKFKNRNTLFYRNKVQSLDPDGNLALQSLKDIDVSKHQPIATWTYNSIGYAAYQLENYMYFCEHPKKGPPLTQMLLVTLRFHMIRQRDHFKPYYLQTPRCQHILVKMNWKIN